MQRSFVEGWQKWIWHYYGLWHCGGCDSKALNGHWEDLFSSQRKGPKCGMRLQCDYMTSIAYRIPCTLIAAAGAQPKQLLIALHGVAHRPSQLRQLIEPPLIPNMVNGAFRRRESWSSFSPTTRWRQGIGLTLNRPSGLKLLLIWAHYILMSHLAQLSAQVNREGCISVYFHSNLLILIL